MQTIKVYTVGVDPLPIEGTMISVIEATSSFGMFESHYTVNGQVGYISNEDIEEYGLESAVFTIDDHHYVEKGARWMYDHEQLPVISDIQFPFQDWVYYNVALKKGWCNEQSVLTTSWNKVDGVEISFKTCHTVFNGKKFVVEWVQHKDEQPTFQEWSEEETL